MDCHSELNPTATPCFLESFKGRLEGRLNESQYLNHILKHFCGVKHQADFEDAVRITTVHNYLRRYDRVGENIRCAALSPDYPALQDSRVLERIFRSASIDDAQGVRTLVADLQTNTPTFPVPFQALATFATSKKCTAVLRLCLQNGASLDTEQMESELYPYRFTPSMLDVLLEADWKGMRTSGQLPVKLTNAILGYGAEYVSWLLDHGAVVTEDEVWSCVGRSPFPAETIQIVIERNGNADVFKDTRLLPLAAKRGQDDLVKVLLDAGVDPNIDIPDPVFDMEMGPCLALWEAVGSGHESTVRLLLRYGADPRVVCSLFNDNSLQLAEKQGDSRMVKVLIDGLRSCPGEL